MASRVTSLAGAGFRPDHGGHGVSNAAIFGKAVMAGTGTSVLATDTLINANASDYLMLVIYFGFVVGIGLMAGRQVSESLDFFLSGRSMPAWVTGLAFISANLGAVEIMGMSASG